MPHVIQYIADCVAVMYAGNYGLGAVRQSFERPLHPYKKGLVASNMSLGVRSDSGHQLKGEILLPSTGEGRRLESSCPIKVERCKWVEPSLQVNFRPAGYLS